MSKKNGCPPQTECAGDFIGSTAQRSVEVGRRLSESRDLVDERPALRLFFARREKPLCERGSHQDKKAKGKRQKEKVKIRGPLPDPVFYLFTF